MISTEQTSRHLAAHTAAHLKAMANPVRLEILTFLNTAEEASVGSIEAVTCISQSAVSQHLRVLRDAHLVETRRESQTIFYRLNREHIADVLRNTTSLIED